MNTTHLVLPWLCDRHAGAMWSWLRAYLNSSGQLPPRALVHEQVGFLCSWPCDGLCTRLCEAPAIVATQADQTEEASR